MRAWILALVAATTLGASTGCMGWWLLGPDPEAPRAALQALAERERRYADTCADWGSIEERGDEPDRYVDDVYELSDAMIDSCAELMRAGRLARGDYDDIDDARGRLRVAVDGHHGRVVVIVEVDDLHAECADHHQEMLELLDATEASLAAGGMMGGGMR